MLVQENVRERIITVAGDLFARDGVETVAIDEIIAAANVSRTTFYRYFRSKDELVAEYLRRLDAPLRENLIRAATRDARDASDALLGLFDGLERWFRRPEFCGCIFTNASLAFRQLPGHPAHRAAVAHKNALKAWIRETCASAGTSDPDEMAEELMLLVEGAITSAVVHRDPLVARRARNAAARLIGKER